MSETKAPAMGSIGWTDRTVPDAPGVRDFYAAVAGWKPSEVSMGEERSTLQREQRVVHGLPL